MEVAAIDLGRQIVVRERIESESVIGAAEVADVLAEGQAAIHVDARQRLVGGLRADLRRCGRLRCGRQLERDGLTRRGLETGEPIAEARLNAIPWTRSCITCKEKQQA